MATYDQDDWTKRVIATFPAVWRSSASAQPGGMFYSIIYNTFGLMYSYNSQQLSYVQLQTRLLTATDTNVEAIANDFFGVNAFPRMPTIIPGTTLTTVQTDQQYAASIAAQIFQKKNTIAAIQAIVASYLTNLYVIQTAAAYFQLGADTAGGLDTSGALDIVIDNPTVPACYVFDRVTDPARAALVGLTAGAGQFCILFQYGSQVATNGFFTNFGFLDTSDANTFLVRPVHTILTSPLTPYLGQLVQAAKSVGTTPVYAVTNTGD